MADLTERYQAVLNRIQTASQLAGRDPVPGLLAVSKRHTVEKIRTIYAMGQRDFGENYVQEALEKITELADLNLVWHFIGPIQSNKCQAIATHFDWVHSVDRLKVLNKLNQFAADRGQPLNVLLQLKVGGEASKSGVGADELMALARECAALNGLVLRGLMSIPPLTQDQATQLGYCREAASVYAQLKAEHSSVDTLSLGMSGDLEAAVTAGSDLLRIGTDVFGPRD